jgi:Flp pilus assembly protein protease CpaA
MELLMGVLTDAFFIGLLIWCSYTDTRKRMVSNVSVILLLCLGIVHMVLMGLAGNTWWTYPAGMVFTIPFFISWLRGGMGAGDVKLVMAITLYLGLMNAVMAFALMIPVLAVLMIKSLVKEKTLKCRIPVTPVLSFGAVGAILTGYLYALISI